MTTPVAQERDRMSSQCVHILHTYRKFCATASSSGQLILPEGLKLLPLYTMGTYKPAATCDAGYVNDLLSGMRLVMVMIRGVTWL